jgi:alanine racemase
MTTSSPAPALRPALEIDLAAIVANYQRIAEACRAPDVAAVVKCDAYGAGAHAVALALYEHAGCKAFYVAYPEEGVVLRSILGARDATIYVFNGPSAYDIADWRDARLTPVINSLDQALLWRAVHGVSPVALHIDSGLNRLGIPTSDLDALPDLSVAVAISHLACASEPMHPMNGEQHARFAAAAARFPKARRSLSASAGALIDPSFALDQVRIGIGLYGASPFDEGGGGLEQATRLLAPVIQVKSIGKGDAVGYGGTFVAQAAMKVATVSLGYGDGYPRAASGMGSAILRDRKVPILGRVSMDLIVLDASHSGAETGDFAEFYGPRLPIEQAAAAAGMAPYELLTAVGGLARPAPGVGARVRRRYLWNGAPLADAAQAR